MKLVRIKNTLAGILDLAPLKDETGRTLALKGNEERDVTEEVLGHPVVQRVLDAKWLAVVDAAAPAVTTEPPPAPPAPAEIPVIKTSAPPEELKMPEELASVETTLDTPAQPAAPEPPPVDEPAPAVETTVTSETSIAPEPTKETPPAPSGKSGKQSRK